MKEEARLVVLRTTHVAVLGGLPILLWSVAELHVRAEPGIPWWGWVMLVYGVVATVVFRTITRKKIVQAPSVAEAGTSYISGYLILLGLATSEALVRACPRLPRWRNPRGRRRNRPVAALVLAVRSPTR
jgi:hypothetical protein